MTESNNLRISSKRAAELLGVSVGVLHRYKIPYQQYAARGRRTYLKKDVTAFKEKHTFNVNSETLE